MSFTARVSNESIKSLLILLLIAFLSGTLIGFLPLYFLAQHEPKELFSTTDMMTVYYAPLWIALAAVQFGPFIVTATNRKFRPFRKYALAILLIPFVMAVFPRLDPTYYSSYYTRCARLSESDVIELARAWIAKKGDTVVGLLGAFSQLGDTIEDVRSAELVQLIDWRPGRGYSFSAKYQTSRGGLFSINIGPECAVEVSLTSLAPPLGRLIYQKQ
jgi:hypothetical protein